jgi:hypothetical protein
MKQHYVPRCYLNGFSDENSFLYAANLKLIEKGYDAKPKQKNISSLCILDDYYNLLKKYNSKTFRFNHYEELYVESNILGKSETKYKEIRDRLISGINVKNEDFDYFANFIIQLKLRNIYWYENVLKKKSKQWITESMTDTLDKMQEKGLYNHIPKGIKQLIINDTKLQNITDEDFPKKMQLHSLIERQDLNNPHNMLIRTALLSASWTIWELPETSSHFFITSDNPGYSIGTSGEPENTKFKDKFTFYLPLASRHCLVISDIESSYKPPVLTKRRIPEETARVMNFYTCHVINERVFSIRKNELEVLNNFFKSMAKV